MGTDATQERQQPHALLDKLSQEKFTAVVQLLQAISDPLARSLANAPIDDAPISAEEMRAVEASRERLKDRAHFPRTSARRVRSRSRISNAWAGPLLTLTAKASDDGKEDRLN
jgi:hypothetical protein